MSAGMELLLQEFPAIFLKNEWKQQQWEIFGKKQSWTLGSVHLS